MLESQQFLFRAGPDATLEIVDPLSGDRVGVARELRSVWSRLLPRCLRPITVAVIEQPEGALVFTMRRGWRGQIEVYDAEPRRVGIVRCPPPPAGPRIYDRKDTPLAEAVGRWEDGVLTFHAAGGDELGSLMDSRLSVADELAEQPFAKMLLLAAAIAAVQHNRNVG